MRKTFFVVLSISLFSLTATGKDPMEQASTYTVYINYEDYSVRANVLFDTQRIHPKNGLTYFWYVDNDIKSTEGSFDGKLLHGEYKSFFRNKNLKEQGNFRNGLKDGEWKTWYDTGKLHEIIKYKNGLINGGNLVYDEKGYLVSKSNYRSGEKSGKSITYKNGKVDTIIVYKKGEPKVQRNVTPLKKLDNKSKLKLSNKDPNSKSQDTVASSRKSRFSITNVFHKKKKGKNTDAKKDKRNDSVPSKPKQSKSTNPKKSG